MILTNTETIPGKVIEEHYGVVSGSTVRAKHIGRDIMAGFKNIIGGELKGYTELLQEARDEAKRCLTCGPCVSCKACISIGFEKSLYSVAVDEQRCSGCGMCVYVCNYESARLTEVEGKTVSTTDMFRCKSCGMCVVACPSHARRLVDDDTEERIFEAVASL